VAADTTLTVKSDTAAYFVLDTVNLNLYTYKASATGRKWRQLGADTASIAYVNTYGTQTVNGAKTFTSAVTATRFNPTANTATGTGMFLPATNTLGFSTNGTNKMTIDASGYIGINSTTVDGNNLKILSNANGFCLDLEKTAAFGALIQLKNTSPSSTGIFRVINNANAILSEYTPTTNGINYSLGNVGIASATTSARLHLGFGTENSGTSPLKFTSGVLNTNPEVGAMEFVSTNLYFTPNSGVRHTVNHGLPGSATLNFPSTNAQLSADLTITVTGAADGDVVSLGVPNAAVNANTSYSAWVSAANTVTVRFNNYSSGTVDPASALFKVFVTK
jgi:hypothetical protein